MECCRGCCAATCAPRDYNSSAVTGWGDAVMRRRRGLRGEMGSLKTTVLALLLVAAGGLVDGQLLGENDINTEPVDKAKDATKEKDKNDIVEDVGVLCNSEDITLTLRVSTDTFNGMIYPKGLSKNSTCMTEYIQQKGIITYTLPLRSCNTMSTDVSEGQEYFNTVVVQPHRKLVTNQGRGYHVRCRYQTQEKTLTNDFAVSHLGTTPLTATAAMPASSMRIFFGEASEGKVAENVKIGDPLTLVISIDEQDIYGMHVTQCLVRDGLGWSEQALINSEGCPQDREIMGELEYSQSKTTALVHFQAHKFPYTSSVYYQCNVKLCIKHAGGCDQVPPICDDGVDIVRKKRQVVEVDERNNAYDLVEREETIKVYSGLYVNEAQDLDDDEFADNLDQPDVSVYDPNTFCISQRSFAIGIAIAGLILMTAVVVAIMILVSRRRRKTLSTTGSSIYSGPYTNTAYSHSSMSRRS